MIAGRARRGEADGQRAFRVGLDGQGPPGEPIALHRALRQMADAGCTHVVMEASSQAMKLKRLYGLEFAAGSSAGIQMPGTFWGRGGAHTTAAAPRSSTALSARWPTPDAPTW